MWKKINETADCGLADTLTMVDIRERSYSGSGYHRFKYTVWMLHNEQFIIMAKIIIDYMLIVFTSYYMVC